MWIQRLAKDGLDTGAKGSKMLRITCVCLLLHVSMSPASCDEPAPAVSPFSAKEAKSRQKAWAKHLGLPVQVTNSVGMKLVLIPPGKFIMGSPPGEDEGDVMRRFNTT